MIGRRRVVDGCAALLVIAVGCGDGSRARPVDVGTVRVDLGPRDSGPDTPDVGPSMDAAEAGRDAALDASEPSDAREEPRDVDSSPPDASGDTGHDAGCADGLTACAEDGGIVCVDLRANWCHCGACGNDCIDCFDGFCGDCSLGSLCYTEPLTCAVDPSAQCAYLDNDSFNCGACDHACPSGFICFEGICTLGVESCGPGVCPFPDVCCRGECCDVSLCRDDGCTTM